MNGHVKKRPPTPWKTLIEREARGMGHPGRIRTRGTERTTDGDCALGWTADGDCARLEAREAVRSAWST